MRLTLHTDYALRLLTYLALKPDEIATISEVAESYSISRNHLTKVAHELGRAGFVETLRGRGGGLRLARAAGKIGIGDVVRAMEEDFCIVECFAAETDRCRIGPACRLKRVLKQALDAWLAVLDDTTLADLVERPQPLRRLLALAG
ncbi:transcriptional regulator, BadM/Rrf2 family [Parvibaculum lavamentivorans DS-1]|uniref:Transcriptional regulator, BadM/Rrf2 family n=1 Tax=Parvibaculum lavamentivorans (strain DS-1 / DSM 13023 / NCIMB 13966) TaxID=402881 RepID=A7HWL4_PARL1|nr:Rrf2 family transcriptional regulator [Parvibaculum lavamentivorans]ABS64297.1 transcriptional regulator, BadM/Rrf2 family [Parvibaculum lavamentivorans DS-1]